MNELALFAGAGGGILGAKLLGWRTVCGVEIEPYPIGVLIQRQNEGILPPFPIWDDVRSFDGKPWRGIVDVVSGGFPCQDISAVRKKEDRTGLDGSKSGLWFEFARIINEVRPAYAFVENSDRLVTNGLDRVLGSLAEIGYDAEWCVLGADDCGASHKRKRIWIVARNSEMCGLRGGERRLESKMAESSKSLSVVLAHNITTAQQIAPPHQGPFPKSTDDLPEPRVYGSGDGLAGRVDRTHAVGNGQVPIVAATAWNILLARFQGEDMTKKYTPELKQEVRAQIDAGKGNREISDATGVHVATVNSIRRKNNKPHPEQPKESTLESLLRELRAAERTAQQLKAKIKNCAASL